MDRVLKVVVIDDSAYVRKVVKEILSRSPFVEVVGTARDGREALDLVAELDPDVVTCDLIMPELDGVGFVREQMQRRPVPIIIMSVAKETAEAALTALDRISAAPPPSTVTSEPAIKISGTHSVDIVVIGISTGGPQALKRLIPQLPEDFPVAVAMVMHMPVGYTEVYAAKLNDLSRLEVREAAEGA